MSLPKYAVFKAKLNNKYLRYLYEDVEAQGYLQSSGEEIYDLSAKFSLERANSASVLVNIRSCYHNKYLTWSKDLNLMLPTADEPDEDQSADTCTLFEPLYVDLSANTLRIRHVKSLRWACLRSSYAPLPRVDYVLGGDVAMDFTNSSDIFTLFDWDTLLIMPKYVAFKGYNDKYLRASWIESHEYLQFSGDDKGALVSGHEVTMNSDGFLRIKSRHYDKYWRRSPNWIWADSTDSTSNNSDTLFWPAKVNQTTIALRSEGNQRFCKSLTTEGKTDCLNAADEGISQYANLQVEELVSEREIYNVRYRMEDARIYNEMPFIAGSGFATNDDPTNPGNLTITVSYEDSKSYSWSNSISLTLGVTNTLEAGIPFIIDSKIEVSAQFQDSYEWGET